jgi:hypothetical protein
MDPDSDKDGFKLNCLHGSDSRKDRMASKKERKKKKKKSQAQGHLFYQGLKDNNKCKNFTHLLIQIGISQHCLSLSFLLNCVKPLRLAVVGLPDQQVGGLMQCCGSRIPTPYF